MEHFSNCSTSSDIFLQYFDMSIIDQILFQSNLYINQKNRSIPPITRNELYAFLGINMVMSYHKLPSWTDYWKGDDDLSVPFVSSTMTRNRFAQILANLHINDNASVPENNQLYKLRPLIVTLNENFVRYYNVSSKVSVDESMIRFKGRSSIKQYNPMKPIKRGYKMWVLADMDGYIFKFDVYQGKAGTNTSAADDDKDDGISGLGKQVVKTMTMDLHDKNHQVYFDNYFTSVPLLEYLKENGVDACGTVRAVRKALPVGLESDLDRGEADYRVSKDGLALFKWQDNKPVLVLSNFHGTELSSVHRTQKDGSKLELPCPLAVRDYNQNMGGVDKADMLCAVRGLNRKSKKWWHRLFFGILDRTVVNAQIVYSKLEKKTVSVLDFRRQVAHALVLLGRPPQIGRPRSSPSSEAPTKQRGKEYSVPRAARLANRGVHWVVYGKKRGRCQVCQVNGAESRPHSTCSACKVFLCCNEKKNCFASFHELLQ